MSRIETPAANHLRRRAKAIKKQQGLPLHRAQELAAQEAGFANWHAFITTEHRLANRVAAAAPASSPQKASRPRGIAYAAMFVKNPQYRPPQSMSLDGHRQAGMLLKRLYRAVLGELRVGQDAFLRERVLFMCSFVRACLLVRENRGDKATLIVRNFYDEYTEQYFRTLPGIASDAGLQEYRDARTRYGSFDKGAMYARFLGRVKSDPAEEDAAKAFDRAWVDPTQFASFASVMDSYTASTIDFLTKQLGRIRPQRSTET